MNFHLPERGATEGPATTKQLDYIRHLAPNIGEEDLRQLGKWQASSLIDQLKDFHDGQKHQTKSIKNAKKSGCGCSNAVVGVAVTIAVLLGLIVMCSKESTTQDTDDIKPPPSQQKKPLIQPLPLAVKESRIYTEQRSWRDRKGRELEAALLRLFKMDGAYHGDFEKPDGEVFTYKIGNLSDEDIEFVKSLLDQVGDQ